MIYPQKLPFGWENMENDFVSRFRGSPLFIQTVDSTVMFQNGRVDIPSLIFLQAFPLLVDTAKVQMPRVAESEFRSYAARGMVFGAQDLINGDLFKDNHHEHWHLMFEFHFFAKFRLNGI